MANQPTTHKITFREEKLSADGNRIETTKQCPRCKVILLEEFEISELYDLIEMFAGEIIEVDLE